MSNLYLKKIGLAIRAARKKKGLSQEDFAEITGLHRTYIGCIERGERNIGVLNLIRIAKALNTSTSHLLEDIK